jgi:hypothetical protein
VKSNDSGIDDWLGRDRLPADLYELLGASRFDPDVEKLRRAVRQADRDLVRAPQGGDADRAGRAAKLRRELARADQVLADPARLRVYHTRLVQALVRRYAKRHGAVRDAAGESELKAWLASRIGVHRDRLDAVARAMRAAATAAAPVRPSQPTSDDESTRTPGPPHDDDPLDGWSAPVVDDPSLSIGRSPRALKRSRRRVPTSVIVVGAGVLTATVVLAVWVLRRPAAPPRVATSRLNQPAAPEAAEVAAKSTPDVANPPDRTEHERQALNLRLLPAGSRMLFAAHVARLRHEPSARDVLRGFGPWADAAIAALEDWVRLDLGDVEHVLVGVIPGAAGETPRAAAVVRLSQPVEKAELLAAFGNPQPATSGTEEYYVDSATYTAYYLAESPTVAILPERFAREVLRDVRTPLPTSGEIEALVEQSDRDRLLSAVFDVRFLRDEAARVLDAETGELVASSLDLLGDDVAAGLLSCDTGEEFRVELLLRGARDVRPAKQRRVLDQRLRHLPYDLLDSVAAMRPPQGTRRLIGRFPAMMKALAVVLQVEVDSGGVRAHARLPERAGPNLALAGRLTWHEHFASRGELAAPRFTTSADSSTRLRSVAERLAQPIDVDFRRTPLEEAIQTVAQAAGVEIRLMMEDLQLIGVTRNVPQQLTRKRAPAFEVLGAILENTRPGELVLLLNEKEGFAYVTTRKAAEASP